MTIPTSFRELISAMGGPAGAAEKLSHAGITREHLTTMATRDSIAPEHWPALETAAADAGICVDASDFARWRAGKAAAKREAQSAA